MSIKKHKTVSGTTQDPIVKFAELVVDGVTYKLAWSFNALATAEDMTGANLLSGLGAVLTGNQSAVQLRALLFAALMTAHPDITVNGAGHLIRLDTLAEVVKALGESYKLSMPEDEKKTEPEDEAVNE